MVVSTNLTSVMAVSHYRMFAWRAISASSFLTQPNLTASQQRDADKAAHLEFFAAVDELHLGAIDFAALGIDDFAALIFVTLLSEPPQDRHAQHRLVAPGAVTLIAFGRFL